MHMLGIFLNVLIWTIETLIVLLIYVWIPSRTLSFLNYFNISWCIFILGLHFIFYKNYTNQTWAGLDSLNISTDLTLEYRRLLIFCCTNRPLTANSCYILFMTNNFKPIRPLFLSYFLSILKLVIIIKDFW